MRLISLADRPFQDFSESPGGMDEVQTARFRDESVAEEFHQKLEEAIEK